MTTPSEPHSGTLTSHVLDTALGKPARNVTVILEVRDGPPEAEGRWTTLCERITDSDGRVRDLLDGHPLEARVYRITFETGAYFRAAGRPSFYPHVQVEVAITAPADHHHLPLLLSPFGYSTYRGS